MKLLLSLLLIGLLGTSCVTGSRQSGNLARVLAQNLKDYGAELPHLNLQQPAIGIDQLYTSWRWESDPGGFTLTFRAGTWDGVVHQMKEIAGPSLPSPDSGVRIWQIPQIAQVDVVRLPDNKVRLTCRRLPRGEISVASTQSTP